MDVKENVKAGWNWLKTRQKATLIAGAVMGALFDDAVIGLIQALL